MRATPSGVNASAVPEKPSINLIPTPKISRIAGVTASLPIGCRSRPPTTTGEGSAVTGSAAVQHGVGRHAPSVVGGLIQLAAEREQLTPLLRGLAARLDDLDRRLADLAWRRRRPAPGPILAEMLCERTTLETERDGLSARLGVLARQLNDLDRRLSGETGQQHRLPPKVGTCPECGYPSLGSGLCAFCRPHLVR